MKATKEQLEEFEELCKYHDWYYDYSDDHRVWVRGQEQKKKILDLMNQLGDKAVEIYNRYKKF